MDASVAGEIEEAFARAGHVVVSNSRNHRMAPDVPLLVPEINSDHIALIETQRAARGWSGAHPHQPELLDGDSLAWPWRRCAQYGLKSVLVTTLQALSGAGYPGVASLDAVGNVVPFISGEEAKIESEPKKILGSLERGQVVPHPVVAERLDHAGGRSSTATPNRSPCSSISSRRSTRCGRRWSSFSGAPQRHGLPTAPGQPVVYLHEENRPQPRLDVDRDGGMTVTVGRLRTCPMLGYKFFALGHNTVRGAAGAAVLNAELLVAEGVLASPAVRG